MNIDRLHAVNLDKQRKACLIRLRKATRKAIAENGDWGTITRKVKVSNGFGGMIQSEEVVTHKLYCTIFQESMTDWHFAPTEQGQLNGQIPALLAEWDADVQVDDVLEWRGKTYTLSNVTRPLRFGEATSTQAPLIEVVYGD